MRLRDINIRTIFDLERCVKNPAMRLRLIRILLNTDDKEPTHPAAASSILPLTAKGSEIPLDAADELEAVISYIRDDLHVRRLRQIWDVINGGLDERYIRSERDLTTTVEDHRRSRRSGAGTLAQVNLRVPDRAPWPTPTPPVATDVGRGHLVQARIKSRKKPKNPQRRNASRRWRPMRRKAAAMPKSRMAIVIVPRLLRHLEPCARPA